jgi:hypothetical protein
VIKFCNFNIAMALAHVSRNALNGSFDRHAQYAPWNLAMVGQVRDISGSSSYERQGMLYVGRIGESELERLSAQVTLTFWGKQ